MCDNPYSILNVTKDDSFDTIKKAYRKLSLIYHPDKNNNPGSIDMFQKITDAYQMIVQRSMVPYENHNGQVSLLGKYDEEPVIDIDIHGETDVTLEQAYKGVSIPIIIRREIRQGKRVNIENVTIYLDIPQGVDNDEIVTCEGLGHVVRTSDRANETIGDVKIRIHLHNDTIFSRKGLDLIYRRNITLYEALNGVDMVIQHLDGRDLRIKSKENIMIKSDMSQRIKQYGMKRGYHVGDIVIQFVIVFPDKIQDDALQELSQVLKKYKIN